MANNSVPSQVPLVSNNGTVNPAWLAFFTNLGTNSSNGTSNGNSGFVTGPDAFKGTAVADTVYLATDTLKLYVAQSGVWKQLTSTFTGDVSNVEGSTTLNLTTVNNAPGTYGTTTSVPVPTVDAKGRVTSITTVPIAFPPQATSSGLVADVLDGVVNIPVNIQYNAVTEITIEGDVTVFGTLSVT